MIVHSSLVLQVDSLPIADTFCCALALIGSTIFAKLILTNLLPSQFKIDSITFCTNKLNINTIDSNETHFKQEKRKHNKMYKYLKNKNTFQFHKKVSNRLGFSFH